MIWQSHGSSPLTRGKHVGFPRRPLGFGLIPTHAGKTTRPGGCLRERRAHPHSRGENTRTVTGSPPRRGSSPLTRGKRNREQGTGRLTRLIPTHAGKTCAWRKREWTCWAHPHSRGENPGAHLLQALPGGSSPLTRGKQRRIVEGVTANRLIPTHAGKTRYRTQRPARSRAHPHSRGENSEVSAGHAARAGSSPFTRGKRRRYRIRGPDSGLIPAHAGKTTNRGAHATGTQAHPRSRGENLPLPSASWIYTGSSPLTRGKRSRAQEAAGVFGLIPAHAGKTAPKQATRRAARAHPRSRGKNRPAPI